MRTKTHGFSPRTIRISSRKRNREIFMRVHAIFAGCVDGGV